MYVRLALLVFLGLAVYASAQFQDVHSLKGPFTLPFWSMQGGTGPNLFTSCFIDFHFQIGRLDSPAHPAYVPE
jgi:hypothetical protein